MSRLPPNDQLILYWLADDHHPVPLSSLLRGVEKDTDTYWRIRFECEAAGIEVPGREDILSSVQRLLDEGYLIGWWSHDIDGPPREIRNVAELEGSLDTSFVMPTPIGERQSEEFARLVTSTVGRRRRARLVEGYIQQRGIELSFKPGLPAQLPDDIDVVPVVEFDKSKDYIKLEYYGDSDQFVGPRLIIHQATRQLPSERLPMEKSRDQSIDGTRVFVKEQHFTGNWARLSYDWEKGQVAYRAEFLWSAPARQYIEIDEEMRRGSDLVVRSMLA